MDIARCPSVVIVCSDPGALLRFYGALWDWKIDAAEDWGGERPEGGEACIAFQQAQGYPPPQWPSQQVVQRMHLDVVVADLDVAEVAVLDLGPTKHEHQPGATVRVLVDPA
jgi:Glyoxalase-like domain